MRHARVQSHFRFTGDARPTQRALATYLVEQPADYHSPVNSNQPTLERDIALLLETRRIWRSPALNAYLDFPHVGQVLMIERESSDKRTGAHSREIALGITSRTPQAASPKRVLAVNRGHWSIASVPYFIDWNYDEDRSQIRTGFGPENIARLRRLAVGILKSFQKPAPSIAEMMRELAFRTRLVFDDLRMTQNSIIRSSAH